MRTATTCVSSRSTRAGTPTRCVGWADGRIVYHNGADLHLLDLASGNDAALAVTLSSDFDQQRETWVKKPMEYLTSVALSPKGDRVALTARGQVFVAPAKQGRLVEVTRKAGVRYRRATFLPDGKGLVALSDESGEVELWKLPANGVGEPEKLTQDAKVLRWEAVPSPDGRWIAHHDKDRQLWLWSVDKKADKLVATVTRRATSTAWRGRPTATGSPTPRRPPTSSTKHLPLRRGGVEDDRGDDRSLR